MSENEYRTGQAVKRLFGADARLCGSAGSGRGPGSVEIMVGHQLLGSGSTFQAALADASGVLTASARVTARTGCKPGSC